MQDLQPIVDWQEDVAEILVSLASLLVVPKLLPYSPYPNLMHLTLAKVCERAIVDCMTRVGAHANVRSCMPAARTMLQSFRNSVHLSQCKSTAYAGAVLLFVHECSMRNTKQQLREKFTVTNLP